MRTKVVRYNHYSHSVTKCTFSSPRSPLTVLDSLYITARNRHPGGHRRSVQGHLGINTIMTSSTKSTIPHRGLPLTKAGNKHPGGLHRSVQGQLSPSPITTASQNAPWMEFICQIFPKYKTPIPRVYPSQEMPDS